MRLILIDGLLIDGYGPLSFQHIVIGFDYAVPKIFPLSFRRQPRCVYPDLAAFNIGFVRAARIERERRRKGRVPRICATGAARLTGGETT